MNLLSPFVQNGQKARCFYNVKVSSKIFLQLDEPHSCYLTHVNWITCHIVYYGHQRRHWILTWPVLAFQENVIPRVIKKFCRESFRFWQCKSTQMLSSNHSRSRLVNPVCSDFIPFQLLTMPDALKWSSYGYLILTFKSRIPLAESWFLMHVTPQLHQWWGYVLWIVTEN